jgi:pyrimidine deaminase RibD-like protein
MGKKGKQLTQPDPISGTAIVTAQAVDTLVGALRDDGQPHTDESAAAFVLKAREDAKLELPTPGELAQALAYLRRQREVEGETK